MAEEFEITSHDVQVQHKGPVAVLTFIGLYKGSEFIILNEISKLIDEDGKALPKIWIFQIQRMEVDRSNKKIFQTYCRDLGQVRGKAMQSQAVVKFILTDEGLLKELYDGAVLKRQEVASSVADVIKSLKPSKPQSA